MTEISQAEEISALKKELSKLRLETNLRKSLAMQLEKQKQIADEAKAVALSQSQQLESVSEQLAKYLSPQIYDQIFSGKQSVEVTVRPVQVRLGHQSCGQVDELFQSNRAAVVVVDFS